jgi:S1-C subfamily serine protease
VQDGDVITALNGTPVTSVQEVSDLIGAMAVNDEVSLDVTRDSETVSLNVTLGARPDSEFRTPGLPGGRGNGGMRELGLEYDADAGTWTITRLSEDSALYTAGLREGDVIDSIDGETYSLETLVPYLSGLEQDATVTLSITRDGESQEIDVNANDLMGLFVMGSFNFGFDRNNLPDAFRDLAPMFQSAFGGGRLGISFSTLDADVAEANDLTVTDGALVEEVAEDSPAAAAGLQFGDVITAVNGEAVDAEHTLRDRMVAYEAGDRVTLTVLRDGETQELSATLDEPEMGDLRGMFEHGFPFNFGGRNGDGGFQFEIPVPVEPDAPAANL